MKSFEMKPLAKKGKIATATFLLSGVLLLSPAYAANGENASDTANKAEHKSFSEIVKEIKEKCAAGFSGFIEDKENGVSAYCTYEKNETGKPNMHVHVIKGTRAELEEELKKLKDVNESDMEIESTATYTDDKNASKSVECTEKVSDTGERSVIVTSDGTESGSSMTYSTSEGSTKISGSIPTEKK